MLVSEPQKGQRAFSERHRERDALTQEGINSSDTYTGSWPN